MLMQSVYFMKLCGWNVAIISCSAAARQHIPVAYHLYAFIYLLVSGCWHQLVGLFFLPLFMFYFLFQFFHRNIWFWNCSLASLQLYDQCFLASSMDGSVSLLFQLPLLNCDYFCKKLWNPFYYGVSLGFDMESWFWKWKAYWWFPRLQPFLWGGFNWESRFAEFVVSTSAVALTKS